MFTFLFPDSSNVSSASHDGVETMHVTFKRSGTYRYDNVPSGVYHGLCSAESAGKYIHAQVKDKFPTTKVEGTDA